MRPWMSAFVIVAVASFAQAQDKAIDVVKKAIEAHGGEAALNKFQAGEYAVKGKITVAGTDMDFTGQVTYQLPDKYKMTLEMTAGAAKINIVQVANGKQSKTTVNGAAQKVSDAQKAEVFAAAAMQELTQLTPLLEGKKYQIKAGADADVGKVKAATVQVSGAGLKDVTLYFNKDNNQLLKTSRKGLSPEEKEIVEEAVVSDYKKVEGVWLPMKVEVTHDGKKFMSMEVTSSKLAEKIDPKTFAVDE